jgi:tRNA-dihydrouridine synthase
MPNRTAKTLWDNLPKHFLALAPMEGVTDIVFRKVVASAARPDLFFTEFTNVNSYANEKGRSNALARLEFAESEQPIIAQIWGKIPEHFATTAEGLKVMDYQAVDINMGCPDKNVIRTGGGSALIKTPELAAEIISAAKSARLPVSVKTRLGFTRPEEYETWLPHLLKQNLAALTVHLRTRKEMSKVPAHFELIPEILRLRAEIAPNTKLLINGDITDRAHAGQLFDQYPNLDGIMIGRGVFANPFCFEKNPKPHTREEFLALLKLHLDLYDKYNETHETPIKFDPLKRFFKIYIRDFPGSADLRAELMETKTPTEARTLIAAKG